MALLALHDLGHRSLGRKGRSERAKSMFLLTFAHRVALTFYSHCATIAALSTSVIANYRPGQKTFTGWIRRSVDDDIIDLLVRSNAFCKSVRVPTLSYFIALVLGRAAYRAPVGRWRVGRVSCVYYTFGPGTDYDFEDTSS